MNADATNRIYDPKKSFMKELDRQVESRLQQKEHNRVNQYKGALKYFRVKPSFCTQCKKAMRPDIARKQIENKKENAPICIPCIMGWKRK